LIAGEGRDSLLAVLIYLSIVVSPFGLGGNGRATFQKGVNILPEYPHEFAGRFAGA
jgi:hypothetical protein